MKSQKKSYNTPLLAAGSFILNIPRYVDTFEEEEDIDLSKVAFELRQLDQDMVEVDQAIRGFCEELGIEVPV